MKKASIFLITLFSVAFIYGQTPEQKEEQNKAEIRQKILALTHVKSNKTIEKLHFGKINNR